MTIIARLTNRELAVWAETWAQKNLPPGGNIRKVVSEMAARLRGDDATRPDVDRGADVPVNTL